MGKAQGDFENTARNIITQYFPKTDFTSIQKKLSKDNTYLSLSVIVHPESKTELDELYKALSSEKSILMVL